MNTPILLFDGVFDSLDQAKAKINSAENGKSLYRFVNNLKWIEKQKLLLDAALSGKRIRNFSLLNFIDRSKDLRVLDFGGGIGWGFQYASQLCDNLSYFVLETSESNYIFEKYWATNKIKPNFISDHRDIKTGIDIIYVNSVLQYLENNDEFIDIINTYSPEKIIMDELVFSSSKEFYTLQNYWDTQIPYRFLNLNDLITDIENSGYKVLLKELSPLNLPTEISWRIKNNSKKIIKAELPINIVFIKKYSKITYATK
jgi:putative methyltransferase (TIGR04325 family)